MSLVEFEDRFEETMIFLLDNYTRVDLMFVLCSETCFNENLSKTDA